MDNEIINAAITYVKNLFEGNSDGHGFDHTMRVYNNAMEIAKEESCDTQIVALAALLHDADDHKLFDTVDNANARAFLAGHDIDGETVEAVISAVNSVSFSKNRDKKPESIEGRIVQDADRLDALGAIGIARTFSYG
ncbi:MAG: HD domain-containing protein [Lachnospiraceae bacterium]|nr:HD domain-containing protein [Lachnospiraceae bacterium]